MKKVKKLHLKEPFNKIFRIMLVILGSLVALFIFYRYQIGKLEHLGYSEKASRNILFQFKKDYILSVGENKTLNAAFESVDYKEENLDHYSKIVYQNHKHLISNINRLISKGYSNQNISMILKHGSDEDVIAFSKREKVKYVEEFYSISYAKLKYYDRYVHYADETGEDEETVVLYVNLGMDEEDYKNATIVKEFSPSMLVNKHWMLDESFKPDDLIEIKLPYASEKGMKASKVAINAFIQMYQDAKKEGYGLVINSSYRSYQDQEEIVDTYRSLYGDSYVEKYVALPGYSEHQTGLAFDIGSTEKNVFAESKEYDWMLKNAYRYGFIHRFTKSQEEITGFRSEPWHYRYVGKKIAKYIQEHQITLEEYFAEFLDS